MPLLIAALLKSQSHLVPLCAAVVGGGNTLANEPHVAVKAQKMLLAGKHKTYLAAGFSVGNNSFHKPRAVALTPELGQGNNA